MTSFNWRSSAQITVNQTFPRSGQSLSSRFSPELTLQRAMTSDCSSILQQNEKNYFSSKKNLTAACLVVIKVSVSWRFDLYGGICYPYLWPSIDAAPLWRGSRHKRILRVYHNRRRHLEKCFLEISPDSPDLTSAGRHFIAAVLKSWEKKSPVFRLFLTVKGYGNVRSFFIKLFNKL